MALIYCRECGGQVSDRATECPHCGCPIEIIKKSERQNYLAQKPKKKRKFIVICFLLLALLGVCGLIGYKFDLLSSNTLKITPEFAEAVQKYDRIDAFSEGMAAVRRDGKWGYINLKGEEVIPCQFSDAFPVGQFSEGLACVVDDRASEDESLINKRVGFINKKGEWVIEGDYYTEIPSLSEVWSENDHTLPSFKDGMCAVWNLAATNYWDDNNENSKIMLVNKNGTLHEVADTVGFRMYIFHPYQILHPFKDIAQNRERSIVYDDYALTIARDTVDCDNGARLVTWQILDINNYPFQTGEKTVQYFIDNSGNSSLSTAQEESMAQHLVSLRLTLIDRHNWQLEEERRRQEEEERLRRIEWVFGTWEYNGFLDMGRYLGGRRRVTSRLVISEDNLSVFNNGSLSFNGSYEIEDGRIVYGSRNGSSFVLPLDQYSHRIEFDRGGFYSKISSSTNNNSYHSFNNSSSNSTSTNFRSEADVWAYLSGRTFSGNGTYLRVCPQYLEIRGTPATGAIRITNIRENSATLVASSQYLGGQTFTMYLNASSGTITSDGLIYYSR